MNLVALELKLLCKSRAVVLLCAAYVLLAFAALFAGQQRFLQDTNAIEQLQAHYSADRQEWRKKAQARGAGYAAYYLSVPATFEPSPWAILFRGERAENDVFQRIRLLSVQGQIHGSPIRNVEHSVVGNLDVGFVWLYLLPVLIGLISVTCVADDKRLGRWPLLSALASAPSLVARRLALRFALVLWLNVAVLFVAVLSMPALLSSTLFKIFFLLFMYSVFWILVAALIIYFYLNARQSTLVFIGVWIFSVWMIPSVVYMSQLDSRTYNTGIELLAMQRQYMNDSWDRNKKMDFEEFIALNPKWQGGEPLGTGFEWKWYFAMQKASDQRVGALAESYFASRTQVQSIFKWLSPTLVAQRMLEDLSHTGAKDQQDYLKAIVQWHQALQDFWFPYFFYGKAFKAESIDGIPEFRFQAKNSSFLGLSLYWLVFIGSLLVVVVFTAAREHWLRSPRKT